MNRLVVVDTSVIHKWFVSLGEDGRDEALSLLDAHVANELVLVAPASLCLELANSLRYTPVAKQDVIRFVTDFPLLHIELFEATPERLERALMLAYAHRITVYDAIFLGLAEELDCPLVSADKRAFGGIESPVEVRLI